MRTILLALAATAAIGVATNAVEARGIRTRVYVEPIPAGLTPEDVLDYRLDQLERRQEIEREALRFNQRAERRQLEADED